MSPDTAKEIACKADSSAAGLKKDMVDLHDPVTSKDGPTGEACPPGAEQQLQSCGRTRYFIMKSLNHHNIQLSIKKGIWATQVMNEPILEEAFQNTDKVILIFSVNSSGCFQGYAQMISSVSWRRDNIWSQGKGKNKPWGRSFRVKWLSVYDLPFQKTLHLKNPWNDYKTVKISRDCQELPPDVGEALCQLLAGGDCPDPNLERDEVCRNDFPPSGPSVEPFHPLQNEEYNVPPFHMAPFPDPFLYYQHQAEVSQLHLQQPGAGAMPDNSSFFPGISNIEQSKSCQTTGSKGKSCLFDGILTEDDLVEMAETYEEYLELVEEYRRRHVHSWAGQWMCFSKSTSTREPSTSARKRSDDPQSTSKSKSKKRTRRQSRQ